MTRQEIIDKIWDAYVVNKEPLGFDDETRTCIYIGPQGQRCWVGFLLDEETATKCEEFGNAVDTILGSGEAPSELEYLADEVGLQFLCDLQSAHDDCSQDTSAEKRISKLCKRWGLRHPKDRT